LAGIVFDTSVYVNAARTGDIRLFSQRWMQPPNDDRVLPIWLSSVVLEELYAGAIDAKATEGFKRFEAEFEKVNRLLVPIKNDWATTGRVLNKIGHKYGFEEIGRSRLTSDALIAMTVARTGMTLFTSNRKDFARIDEFRSFRWELV